MEFGNIDFKKYEQGTKAIDKLKAYFSEKNAGYYIKTFGCQMNVHDSERLAGMLESMGLTARTTPGRADVVIVNTCCVREHAEVKVYGNVGGYCKMKRTRGSMIIGVCGCMMQQKNMVDDMRRRFPDVDFFMGTHTPHLLAQTILEAVESGKRQEQISPETGPVIEGMPIVRSSRFSAWVNIMYGCDNFCTYCIVPFVRGRERSREPGAILGEIESLAQNGCVEVTLLGQNVNSYGKGLSENVNFAGLLRSINEIDGIRRIRFMTSHPKDLSAELIDAMAECRNVCRHLHLPVQSGSDRILRVMNRQYTRDKYLGIIKMLRERIPDIGLTTDLIVGFPGETEQDFEDTLSLVRRIRFDSAFMFKYSRRRGTIAEKLEETVSEQTKKERLYWLIETQQAITEELNAACVGTLEEVLVESVSAKDPGAVSGKTSSGRMVNIRADAGLIGKIVPVRITQAKAHSLCGEIAGDRGVT